MKSLRQTSWYIEGFFKKYQTTLLVSFLSAFALAILAFLLLPRLPRPKPHLYVGVIGKFTLSQIPPVVEKHLGAGLVTIDSNLTPQPGLASRWEISDAGKTYRFYLKDNLHWSNGQPLKLTDLEFVIPDTQVTSIEPNTIEFRLPEPFAPLPSALSKPIVKDGTLTTGQFSIKDIQLSGQFLSQIQLESNKQKITYKFFDNTTAALLAFKLGSIDQVSDLLAKPTESDWPNTLTKEYPRTDIYIAIFYDNDHPFLADKNLRQALSYAIENKTFNQLRALSPIDPLSWAYNKTVKTYDYNLARAKELIKKVTAGNNNELKLELATTPELLAIAESIKRDWEKISVTTDIKVVASRPASFQALLLGQPIPPDPDQYIYWHSTQETNFTNFQDLKVDKLLEDGRQTFRLEDRRVIYFDFQRFLIEESPATFLYHPTTYTITRKSKFQK